MKNINAFKEFLTDEVNLNQSRIDTLEQKIETIKTLLKDNLDYYCKVKKQGHYAMQTIIKPVKANDEFDADLLIYFSEVEDREPSDYIQKLYDLFKNNGNYAHPVKKKTRCVTLDYSGNYLFLFCRASLRFNLQGKASLGRIYPWYPRRRRKKY